MPTPRTARTKSPRTSATSTATWASGRTTTASAEAGLGDDGATLGAQATAVGATVGYQGEHEGIKAGLSEGVGAAGRLHWGQDKDGFRNYGVGADFGPFSFDITTNDPLHTAAGLIPGMGPVASYLLPGQNTTESAANMLGLTTKNADLGTTWDAVKGGASKMADGVSNTASSAWGSVTGAAGSLWDSL